MKKQGRIEKISLINMNEVDMDLIRDWDQHLNDRMLKMGYEVKEGGYNSLDYHKCRLQKVI